MAVFDERICDLGEGPLWHPVRQQLFWFDINGKRLLSRDDSGPLEWAFDEHVSAAGWIDDATLLIASETGLVQFDIASGETEWLAALEADNPVTRSNDGRADPWGGFWIGTMGKQAERRAGAIYRYFDGRVVRLFDKITISNAICFAPDHTVAYFTDTPTRKILRQPLDEDGWPDGKPDVFVDFGADGPAPDGAVVDAEGCVWNAQWGAGRVARYGPDGEFLSAVDLPARQTTCPAFGGSALSTLFTTSAAEDLADPGPGDGQVFAVETGVTGQAEHQVRI